jgi:DNA-binding winged helix-turn-helix (wHTH) protein/WD40 repeat protein
VPSRGVVVHSPSSVVYRFGTFELDLSSGELRRNGTKQKIQDQPFHVLVKLLDHNGEIVTREELQRTLWPADTYVSFETGLNTAIKRLREVLGDSAESPIFIGTIPKRGYRFLAPVNQLGVALPLSANGNGNATVLDPETATLGITTRPSLLAVRRIYVLLATLALLAAIGIAFFGGKFYWLTPPASFHRLSFRRGYIPSARFGVDSQTIVYSAAWDGGQPELFSTRSDSPESRQLGLGMANLLAVSRTGQMAIARAPITFGRISNYKGTLAQAPLAGGAARELLDDVMAADWDSAGKQIAVVRMVGDRCRLEFPLGKVLYESKGFISNMRISPNQRLVAFLDHPNWDDDRGSVAIVDVSAKVKMRSPDWGGSVDGLAWSPKSDEVWFTASVSGAGTDLYAVNLAGRQRVIQRIGARLVLQDISPDGRVLITEENERFGITGLTSAGGKERDLSWLDYSFLSGGLSADGNTIVFSEESEASGPNYAACIRKLDGSLPVRLGEGVPGGLSPDGKWVLSSRPSAPGLLLLPTGAGQVKFLEPMGIEHGWGKWFPDGKHVLIEGNAPGRPQRSYIQSIDGGQLKLFTPEGVIGFLISQDGKGVIAVGPKDGVFSIYPIEGGAPLPLPGMEKEYWPIQWSADGKTLYVRHGRSSAQIYRVNVSTGERSFWKEIVPADPAGLLSIDKVDMTRDGRQIVYGYARITSDLYVVDGLR